MSSVRFTGVAGSWLECLPLGDGRLGVMTDGGIDRTTLHLNDVHAWSGSPDSETAGTLPDAAECARLLARARAAVQADDPIDAEAPLRAMQTHYAQSFLPLGTATITADRAASRNGDPTVARSLDLATGIHRSSTAEAAATTLIEPVHSVLVHELSSPMRVDVALTSPLRGIDGSESAAGLRDGDHVLLLRLPSDVAPGHEPDLPAARWEAGSLEAAVIARVIRSAESTRVLIATATTFIAPGERPSGTAIDALADARRRLDRVAGMDAEAMRQESAAALRAALGSVELHLEGGDASSIEGGDTAERFAAARSDHRGVLASDPGLVALLFDYGRYLLACSSRDGGLPATLQGIWNAEMRPPWGSGYTLNINTPMNYWGAQVTDLAASTAPLTDFTLALADAASSHTRRLYDAPGWTVHHNTDAWLYATAPGRGSGDPRWSFWPLGGAWLAMLLTENAEFGHGSSEDLERVWPALRGAAEFVLAWHRDGQTSPATSPENAFLTPDGRGASLAGTTTMDLSLVRTVLQRTARTAAVLGLDDDEVAREAGSRMRTLPDQPALTSLGTIVEWDVERPEEDPHHRHLSALFGLFPGTERWDDEHRAAAARTLDRRGDDSSGWSLVWKLALWARLGRRDRVSDLIALFLRDADEVSGPWAGGLYPNLFAAHPPFQIDANLGFVGALSETLLQSHDGIRLLPALPVELATGSVTGLVARPGITVDIEWREGRLVRARLRARHERAVGEHRVHWDGRTASIRIDSLTDTVIDPLSFPTEEVHP
nr:glycoside hydrolase N-terminal domain-containing protein [uncultured Microbacterium sp.]